MISQETQLQLAKVILSIARSESALETIRQILAEQQSFSPYTAFRRIDRKNKAFIDKNDLQNFLKYHQVIN